MDTNPTGPPGRSNSVAWIAIASIAIAGFALMAFLETCHTTGTVTKSGVVIVDKITRTVDHGVDKAAEAAARFKTGTITHTFIEQNTQVFASKGDILRLGSITQDETFIKTDSKQIIWDLIYVGTTTSEIRAPVSFHYQLHLSDQWKLATRDNVCLVLAPQFEPIQPPAINTGLMVKRTSSGWARFNASDNLDDLERGMTAELMRRAADRSHRALVREVNRQDVANFVKNWLLREDRWREDRFSSIVVAFPDELKADGDIDLENLRNDPTVKLETKNPSPGP